MHYISKFYLLLRWWKYLIDSSYELFLSLKHVILLPWRPSTQVPDQGPRVPGLSPAVPRHHHQVARVLPHRPAAGHAAGVARQRCGVPPAPTSPLIHVGREVWSPRLLARQHRHPIQVLSRLKPGFAHCQCQGQIMGGGLELRLRGFRRHWAGRSTPDCHKWKEGV